ncbi:MAG: LPS O-antigen subunit length determinant protein (WzzB/FepE family) [Flavobacteriales bacterium]|jgi:hypothetical protein
MTNQPTESSSNTSLDSTNLLVFLFKWRWHIIVLCAVAAISSAVVSGVIEEKFRSAVTMFAVPQNSIGEQFYEEQKKNDLLEYGDKEDAERMLQILNSDRVRVGIIKKYNLWEHYDIEQGEAGANTKMQKEYDSNVGSRLTKFGSIQVEVLDKTNTTARDIANDIAHFADSVANKLRNDRAMNAFQYAQSSLLQVQDEIRVMEDSMSVLYNLGVYDYITQIEGLNDQFATAIIEGQPGRAETIRLQMAEISQYANTFNKLTTLLEAAYDREAILKKRFDLMKIDATSNIPSTFIVDSATASDKKAYPVRWLIVAMSIASMFVFSVISILSIENYRKLKREGKI